MRLLRVLFLPVSLLLLAAATLAVPLPVFMERPGSPVSLTDHVSVDAPQAAGDIDGDFLLTLVNLRRATTAGVVVGLFDADTEFIFAQALTAGLDDAEYFEAQRDLFDETADMAAALALEAADFPVERSEASGALVVSVLPGAPADGVLRPGDVITSVEGEPIRGAGQLVEAIRQADGPQVELGIRRDDERRQVRVAPGPVPQLDQDGLGVQVNDLPPEVDLPFPVEVDAGAIGGPSAGLMIALTVYDTVSDEDLAAGRRIAGTGAIDARGHVQPVGGVDLKVVAADRDGADVFVSPVEQVPDALAAVPGDSALEIVGVATFSEALDALRDGDGRTARSPGPVGRLAVAAPRRAGAGALVDWRFPPRAAPGG